MDNPMQFIPMHNDLKTAVAPTVGLPVHFHTGTAWGGEGFVEDTDIDTYHAVIAHVNRDGSLNLTVSDRNGNPHGKVDVPFLHPWHERPSASTNPRGFWCEWPIYRPVG